MKKFFEKFKILLGGRYLTKEQEQEVIHKIIKKIKES